MTQREANRIIRLASNQVAKANRRIREYTHAQHQIDSMMAEAMQWIAHG